MALTQKEISHNCYKRRKDNGLCPRCGKPLDRTGYYCSDCLKKNNEREKEFREWCKEYKICSQCKKNKLFGDEHICPECLARKAMYRANNPISDEKQKQYNERFKKQQRALYQQRKEQGICTRCGKRPAAKPKAKCAICLKKNAQAHKKQYYDKIDIKEYRKANNLCYHCGNPIDRETGQLCQSCWDKCRENGLKSPHDNTYWRQDNNIVFKWNRGAKNEHK